MTQNLIEVAESARSFYLNYINTAPVDLDSLCKDFGWILRADNLDGEDGYVIIINKSNKAYIYYDNSPKYIRTNRYRFTIAHEIGHLILKHHFLNQDILSNDDIHLLEKEADIVAAEILMPYSILKNMQSYNINELSTFFKVSKEAMTVRLDSLGIKNKDENYSLELSSELAF